MLYSGFNILPRSVFWSADLNGRSDNADVIRLKWVQMTFSLKELLLIIIPAGFLLLWMSEISLHQQTSWQTFSLAKLERGQKEGIPAIIACYPDGFGGTSSPWVSQTEDALDSALQDFSKNQYETYRHDYKYWTRVPEETTPLETNWALKNGAGKEPSLILVTEGGNMKQFRFLSWETDAVIEYMDIPRIRAWKKYLFFALFVISSITTSIAIIRHRKTGKANSAV